MTGIKGHTATGCSAHLIDDVIGQRMTPGDHTSLHRMEISVDPRDWPVADAQSIQHRAKVVNTARNYRFCASRAAHSGAGSY